MDLSWNIPSIVMLISGTILFSGIFYSTKGKNDACAIYFKWMMAAASFWAITNGIELASSNIGFKMLFSQFSYIGICSVMPMWLMFVLTYIKKEHLLNKRVLALLFGIPVIMVLFVFTNNYHHLIWSSVTPYEVDGGVRLIYDHGAALFSFATYCYLVMVVGTQQMIRSLRSAPVLIRKQIWLILVGSVFPWISNIIYLLGYSPLPAVDLTPIGFILTGIMFHFAITRFQMLDLMPVARDALFGELIDGVLVLDVKNRIADINPAAADLLKVSEKNIVGKPLNEILPMLYDILLIDDGREIRNGSFELDGKSIDARISTLMEKNAAFGHLIILRDITDIRHTQAELLKAKEEAEAANIAKGQFIANVSHEIRTPMNGMVGFLELLSDTPLNREQADYLNDIKSAAGTLLVLLNDILDYSRIDAGKMHLEHVPFNLHKLLEDTIALFAPTALEKGTDLMPHINDGVPAHVTGDPVRLRQVLNNIIGNAVKFTEQGKVWVTADVVEEDRKNTLLRFEIRDTGIGMSDEVIGRLFNVFTQADASTTRKFGGTGLGLAISKKILDLVDGDIEVKSEPGKGSCFTITLRLEKADPDEVQADSHLSVFDKTKNLVMECDFRDRQLNRKNTSILLVEDIAANRRLATIMLQKLGFDVECAENGKQAVERCNSRLYDLLLMDCQMPVMDGYEASRIIRAGGVNSRTPIVAMTANTLESDIEACLQAGMNDFVTKPVAMKKLEECIDRNIKLSCV